MRIQTQWTHKVQTESLGDEVLTVQGQADNIRTIIKRYQSGIVMSNVKQPIYDENPSFNPNPLRKAVDPLTTAENIANQLDSLTSHLGDSVTAELKAKKEAADNIKHQQLQLQTQQTQLQEQKPTPSNTPPNGAG